MSKIDEVLRRMSEQDRILTRLDERSASQAERNEVTDKRLDSHAADIKSLRSWRSWSAGVGAALSALFGYKLSGHQ